MQILIPDSWLREFIKTDATPKQIQMALSLCGPSVDRLHKKGRDYVYDIEVTTNRVDMMSVVGIARECAAILPRFGYPAKLKLQIKNSKIQINSKVQYLNVQIDKELCSRFSTALINNIKVGESPALVKQRLELCGIRAINNVVDVSNYLMLEMGQPVHTFDYDKIAGHKMILRESKKGKSLITLDEKKHVLKGGDIVIEDGSGKIIDLCGIMGGQNSAVDENTKNVLLFVQIYEPSHIRKTSMSLALRTDAAVLFEKGLATENVLPTLKKGIEMFGGTTHPILDILNAKETTKIIKLGKIDLGVEIKQSEVESILKSLGFEISGMEVKIPWWRKLDIDIPEDLVEEVARIYGYHNLPSVLITGKLPPPSYDKTFYWESKVKSALSHWGFTEAYTYSLVDKDNGLKLKNPLSTEWEYLRTNLTNSHLKIITENMGRVPELNFFEIANVYLPYEELHLILSSTNKDMTKFKGVIEGLELELGSKFDYRIDIYDTCLICEINFEIIIKSATTTKQFTPISKFSPIIEDININLIGSYEELIKKIKAVSPLINNIEFIEKYGDKLTLRITYHDSNRQLANEDIASFRKILIDPDFHKS
ncbi:phenylalanine--tRNA ligase subunit beta [Candidatus Amesbacteria bacterium]|nr:phenylalanine--tRNA ligase subunit beta [Candidatus Amesbacteria bacterium]